jgi:hypothetical protein
VDRACFYTVADAAYFPGAVALVNSLRLAGNDGAIAILDCGLERRQRERLAREAELLPAPPGVHPWFVKWRALLERPAETMVLLDADMVVVRSLVPLVELAEQGKVVAVADLNPERFQEEWRELVGREVRRRTYANSGFLALGGSDARELLARLDEAQQGVTRDPVGGRRPYKYPDQDVLNAVLGAYVPDERLVVLDRRAAPTQPFSGLRMADAQTLDCIYADGARPYLLHHLYAKPWLAWTPTNPYTRLLPRLLFGSDVPIRLDPAEVPHRLRPGRVPAAVREALVLPRVANAARFKTRLELRRAWARARGRATSTRSDREGVAGAR